METVKVTNPPMEVLLKRARAEVIKKRGAMEYAEIIAHLREEKGFTFREIGEWLADNGAGTFLGPNLSVTYRKYKRAMRAS